MQNGSSEFEDSELWAEDGPRAIIELFPNVQKADEAGLAILAAGSVYWVYPYEGQYALVVKNEEAVQLKREISIFQNKNRFWPTVSPDLAEKRISALPTWAFLFFLSCIFYLQGTFPQLKDLGMNSSTAFQESAQWWRIFTAATLHADLGHLVGNLFGLGLFGYFAARYLGNGLGWLSILTTAALSNLTNVFIHWDHAFLSLGASTAVFSALGIVTGFPIGNYFKSGGKIDRRQWLIPLSGGLMLLAWMGGGNYLTDAAGHLWSFLWGLLAAAAMGKMGTQAALKKTGQSILLSFTWVLLAACWLLALSNSGQ